MSPRAPLPRLTRPTLLLACMLVVGGAGASAADESMAPGSPAASSAPTPAASPSIPVVPSYAPLPEQVAVLPADASTVSVTPESDAGTLVVGTAIEYALGHCGLWSPVDLDGSLWQPVGGQDPDGGVIDEDAEIGELINATPGTFVLVTPDAGLFTSTTGLIVAFERAPGALDYPLCM